MATLREKILAATARKRERVEGALALALGLAEGEAVYVAECCGRDLDNYQASRWKRRPGRAEPELDLDNTRAKLLVYCLVGEDWKYLFRVEDAPALGELPATVIDPLYGIALRLCGLAEGGEEGGLKNGQAAAAPSA